MDIWDGSIYSAMQATKYIQEDNTQTLTRVTESNLVWITTSFGYLFFTEGLSLFPLKKFDSIMKSVLIVIASIIFKLRLCQTFYKYYL